MLTPLLVGDFLNRVRKQRGWSQCEVARRTGIDRRRISDYEGGRRVPIPSHQRLLGDLFGFNTSVVECRLKRATARGKLKILQVPRDRDTNLRLGAARESWPELVARLEGTLSARPDRTALSRFLVEVPCDSAGEALLLLRVLTRPGRSLRAAPQVEGFRLRPVVDAETGLVVGDQRVPCLEMQAGECHYMLFPQVSLQVLVLGKLKTYTIDFLVRETGPSGRKSWFVLEVDGAGHDPKNDPLRDQQVGVPVVRIHPDLLLHEDWWQRVARRIPR